MTRSTSTNLIIIIIISLSCYQLVAQPSSVVIQDCANAQYNGKFSNSGFDKEGATCYILDSDPMVTLEMFVSPVDTGWHFGHYPIGTPCVSAPFALDKFADGIVTDVTTVTPASPNCGASVSVAAFSCTAIACIGTININLDGNGNITLNANNFVLGALPGVDYELILAEATYPYKVIGGNGSNNLSEYIGQQVIYEVNCGSGTTGCWGYMTVYP